MPPLDLLTTLILGSYAYTTLAFGLVAGWIVKIVMNHIRHLQREMHALKRRK